MSHEATNWAFKQRGLKPATRVVLLYLADRHNPDYGCFPSQAQLAADCEMSRASVNNHLEELERAGLIRRERRINPETRKQMSTLYILGFEEAFAQAPCPENGHGNEAEPCLKIGESRVQNLDTNPVRESVNTTTDFGADADDPGARCLAACGQGLSEQSRSVIRQTDEVIDAWLAEGLDLDLDVMPVLSERTAPRKQPRTIRTWDYFSEAVRARHAQRMARAAKAQDAEKQHVAAGAPESDPVERLAGWINSGQHVPPSAVSNRQRDELVRRGLVTDHRLRQLQIY